MVQTGNNKILNKLICRLRWRYTLLAWGGLALLLSSCEPANEPANASSANMPTTAPITLEAKLHQQRQLLLCVKVAEFYTQAESWQAQRDVVSDDNVMIALSLRIKSALGYSTGVVECTYPIKPSQLTNAQQPINQPSHSHHIHGVYPTAIRIGSKLYTDPEDINDLLSFKTLAEREQEMPDHAH